MHDFLPRLYIPEGSIGSGMSFSPRGIRLEYAFQKSPRSTCCRFWYILKVHAGQLRKSYIELYDFRVGPNPIQVHF